MVTDESQRPHQLEPQATDGPGQEAGGPADGRLGV